MVDSRTRHAASGSISPSTATVTSRCRSPSGTASAVTCFPNSPGSSGTATSALASATRP